MLAILIYTYYYKYADVRKTIKNDLINNNIDTASAKLNQYLAENDAYIAKGITTEFAVDDNRKLQHAKDHIQYVDIPIQKQATQDAL